MPVIWLDSPPVQAKFIEADVRGMDVGRRQLKTEWHKTLYAPGEPDENWRIILPFANTYENAFGSMCELNHHAHHAKEDWLIIFLNGTEGDQEAPAEAVEWIEKVGHPVAMKDFLAISFALDYDREGGNPTKPQTEIGALRGLAKPYGGSAPSAKTRKAADSLAEHCVNRLARSPKRNTAQAGFSGARVLTAVLPHLLLVSTTMRVDRKRAGDLSLSCPAAHSEEVPGPAKE